MKRLIVNADDLGISARRNAGILEAHLRGIVTSSSLMARGPAGADALTRLKSAPGLDIGLHLNLSEGEPGLPGHKTLVDSSGRFLGKVEARRRAREGLFDPSEIERETASQIETLRAAGLAVSHLDGHQHLHLYGSVAEAVARTAARLDVRWIRLPADTEEYRKLCPVAAGCFRQYGLASPDHFAGSALSGRLDFDSLIETIRGLHEGVTELMVHPGLADTADGFSGPDRERELAALSDPRLRSLLLQAGVELTSFAGLQ